MKKYISAILIDALIIQLCGCYTLRDYTYDEFRDMNDVMEASIIYDTNSKVNLNKDSLSYNYDDWYFTNWVAETDTLRIYSPYYTNESIPDTLILAKSRIYNVQINEVDAVKTTIAILVPILLFLAILEIVVNETSKEFTDYWQIK